MNLKLVRTDFTETSTIGTLYINGVEECFILEDKDRGLRSDMTLEEINKIKQYGITAIPYGTYQVVRTKSERFSKLKGYTVIMPLLLDTPGYAGIRIHVGNYPTNSSGCLLPGRKKGINCVIESTKATQQLEKKIEGAIANGEKVIIEITK